MRRLVFFALALFILTFLLCCQNSQQYLQKERETKLALMHEKERSILAECELKRVSGELKTYAESTECSNPVIVKAHEEAGDPAMNLVYLVTAYRLAVSQRIDGGLLSRAEGNLMLAQLVSRINAERLERDMAAAQQKNRQNQSYEALLRGIGLWKSAASTSAQKGSAEASQPPSDTVQQDRTTPITCYPNESRITCQ